MPAPRGRRRRDGGAAAAPGDRADHQRRRVWPGAPPRWPGGRPRPGQRLAGHRRRRSTSPPSPAATGSPTCSTGLAAAAAAGLGPVKVNAVLDPVTGLDDAVALLRFCLRARLPAADHRADAAGRRPPVAARRADRAPTRSSPRCAAHFGLTPDPAPRGSAPAQLWRVDGGPGHRRRHRVGVARVLLGLRPHPADRRRPGPQLPVRHRGDRSARAAARRRRRRRTRGGLARGDVGARRPVTASTTPTSCSRDRPMSAIGG